MDEKIFAFWGVQGDEGIKREVISGRLSGPWGAASGENLLQNPSFLSS
jgi:hypothetical protein